MLLIESLESRTLLSGSAFASVVSGLNIVSDELALVSDARSVQADVKHWRSSLQADSKAVGSLLRQLPTTTQNRSLLATLKSDQQHWYSTLKQDVSALIRAGSADGHKAVADGIALFLNPNNAGARSHLATDITRLQTAVASPLSRLLSDATAAENGLVTDLRAIAAANPSNSALQSSAQTAESDLAGSLSTARSDVQTVQTDVGTLLNDLNSHA